MSPRYLFYLVFVLTILVFGIMNYQKLKTEYKLLTQLLGLTFLTECISRFLAFYLETSFPVYHLYIIISLIYNGLIYIRLLDGLYRSIIKAVVVLSILSTTLISIFHQGLMQFPSVGMIIQGFSMILIGLLFFYNMLKNPVQQDISKQSVFWYNTGNLVFYCSTFTFYGLFNYLDYRPDWAYHIVWIANIILYSCYLISLLIEISQLNARSSNE